MILVTHDLEEAIYLGGSRADPAQGARRSAPADRRRACRARATAARQRSSRCAAGCWPSSACTEYCETVAEHEAGDEGSTTARRALRRPCGPQRKRRAARRSAGVTTGGSPKRGISPTSTGPVGACRLHQSEPVEQVQHVFHPRRPRTVLLSLCADVELGVSERCRRGAPCPPSGVQRRGRRSRHRPVYRRAMDVGHHSTGRRSSAAISGELGRSPCKTSVPAASS